MLLAGPGRIVSDYTQECYPSHRGTPPACHPADVRAVRSADAPLRLPRRRPGLLLALPRLPITGHRDVPQMRRGREGQAQMTASPETVAYLKQVQDYYAAADRDGTDSYNPPQPPTPEVAMDASAAVARSSA